MNQNFYNSNSFGVDQPQTPHFPVIHPPPQETCIEILHDQENLINSVQTFLRKFNHYSFFETPKELAEYMNTLGWNRPAFYKDDDDNDDVDYTIAITPVLSTEEPIDSLSMGDEHLDTILETGSDEVIKSSVENLVPIPSESEGIPEHKCDVPFNDNSPPLDVSKDQIKDLSDSNEEFSSIDDDSFSIDNIDYVEASPPDSELINSEVMEIVISEVRGIDDDILLTIKNDNLHEKLLNVHLLIANIEALKDNPTPPSKLLTKSSFTSPKSFLEETNTFHNSLPELKNFCFDLEEISIGYTTTHSDISLLDYKAFYFDDDHIEEISSGSELMSILNSGIRENLSTTCVNSPIEDDHSPLLAYVVWIFLAYLTYPVIPPYLHPFGNEDTIFDPGITINRVYSFKPGLSHRSLKDNPTQSFELLTKSSSTSPKSFLEETNTFHNSLPEFENFCFDLEKISSGNATTHSDISLSYYEAFSFDDDHIKEISSGSTTTHSDISLSEYDSFTFDPSNDQCPPTDRSDFTHEDFADELAHIVSPPEYDCFYFWNLPDPGELMSILNSGIHENLSTTCVNLPVEDDHSPLLAYIVKENQEKDKIKTKPDKNEKRGEAGKSQKQLQSRKKEKLKKMQVEGPKMQTPTKLFKKEERKGLKL
uniref:Uncharacterized protein n=1 Tax=Tanacetum cinerariifolium TaxID=118510 RepID=A0A6L2JD95_TANCI|nr:hypothetical protein [Tanacetum cinerariifolium]